MSAITPTPTKCGECKLPFSNMSHLRYHVAKKHPGKLDTLAPKKAYKAIELCEQCGKTFGNKFSLNKHLKNKHPDRSTVVRNSTQCKHCNTNFGREEELQQHMKEHKQTHMQCALCTYSHASQKNIIDHYVAVHNITLNREYLEFTSIDDFNLWKFKIENDTKSSFINTHGSRETKNYVQVQYICHRSGAVRVRGTGVRCMKTQGSKKIGALCPANITMLKKGDKCEVTYFKTHVGHNDELGHLFLTAPQREELAAKIASKIPLSTILDQVRDSVTDCELQRIHLLKKKDLHNIEKSFNLNSSSVRHVNDAVSVDSWAREMEACRVVLYYKPQDTLCEKHSSLKAEDFALIRVNRPVNEQIRHTASLD